MDLDKYKRRQSLKVLASEALMVLTVIITVIILAFVVSGYWLNSDFEVERQGLLQVSSYPTGADVAIDGDSSWLQRTNTSKVLSSGEHTITLTKEGYDSWTKNIVIKEGLLYRLHYPRLFPTERKLESIQDTIGVTKVFISDEREQMLLYSGDVESLDLTLFAKPAQDESIKPSDAVEGWLTLDLKSNTPESKPADYRTLCEFFKPAKEEELDIDDLVKDFQLDHIPTDSEKLILTKFYDDQYLTIMKDASITTYKKGDISPIIEVELSFIPTEHEAGLEGDFIVFSNGSRVATLDMETLAVSEWSVDGPTLGWLDGSMIYSVNDGELIVYDFDGLNRRVVAKNVSSHFPATIANDKWLYYFSDGSLIRESLVR